MNNVTEARLYVDCSLEMNYYIHLFWVWERKKENEELNSPQQHQKNNHISTSNIFVFYVEQTNNERKRENLQKKQKKTTKSKYFIKFLFALTPVYQNSIVETWNIVDIYGLF